MENPVVSSRGSVAPVSRMARDAAQTLNERSILAIEGIMAPESVLLVRNSSGEFPSVEFEALFNEGRESLVMDAARLLFSGQAQTRTASRLRYSRWQVRGSTPNKPVISYKDGLALYVPKSGTLTIEHLVGSQDPTPDATEEMSPGGIIIVRGLHRASLKTARKQSTGEKGRPNKSYFHATIGASS